LKSQTKFKSVEEIDKKIRALEQKQSTTSISLKEEKDLLKEVDELNKQRKVRGGVVVAPIFPPHRYFSLSARR
jgi:uncharacterized coiled-coil DUF342 family protein